MNTFGPTAVAAYTATNRLEQLVQQPFGSLSMALSTYCGQNIGAGKVNRIKTGFRDSVMAMLAMSLIMLVIMQLFGGNLMRMFVKEEDVIYLGKEALRITSLFYVFLGFIYVARGVLNGVGDALFSFMNGIVEIAGRIGLPLLMSGFLDIGVWSIWLTAGMTWMLAGITCILRYLYWRRRWAKLS